MTCSRPGRRPRPERTRPADSRPQDPRERSHPRRNEDLHEYGGEFHFVGQTADAARGPARTQQCAFPTGSGSRGPGSEVRGSGIRGPWVRDRSGDGDGRVRGGAGGAPGTIRGGGVSKSATKASRGGISGEKEHGISTFFFRRFTGVEVFVADLDNPRRHEPPRGAPRAGRRPLWACRRPDGPAGRSLGPRDRHLTREHVC